MPKTALSNRAQKTPPSPIRKLAHLAIKARKAGTHVYKLNIGQPDIESPREYFDGLRLFSDKVIAYEERPQLVGQPAAGSTLYRRNDRDGCDRTDQHGGPGDIGAHGTDFRS